jgi:hypothetical protein
MKRGAVPGAFPKMRQASCRAATRDAPARQRGLSILPDHIKIVEVLDELLGEAKACHEQAAFRLIVKGDHQPAEIGGIVFNPADFCQSLPQLIPLVLLLDSQPHLLHIADASLVFAIMHFMALTSVSKRQRRRTYSMLLTTTGWQPLALGFFNVKP